MTLPIPYHLELRPAPVKGWAALPRLKRRRPSRSSAYRIIDGRHHPRRDTRRPRLASDTRPITRTNGLPKQVRLSLASETHWAFRLPVDSRHRLGYYNQKIYRTTFSVNRLNVLVPCWLLILSLGCREFRGESDTSNFCSPNSICYLFISLL